jgi:triacylglycerol lipase
MMTANFLQLFTGLCATAVSSFHEPVEPHHPRVVLVHGIFEDGTAFTSLRKRLEFHGVKCLVPKLKPKDARHGLDQLAASLKAEIDAEFGSKERFAIVAYSMGGLVSRHYLQKLGGAERCEQFITVSSPHNGTNAAYFYPGKGAKQMRPKSNFLKDLTATESTLDRIPVVSFRTPLDLIILPASSSIWSRAENCSYSVALHPLMLYSKQVLDDLEHRLLLKPISQP